MLAATARAASRVSSPITIRSPPTSSTVPATYTDASGHGTPYRSKDSTSEPWRVNFDSDTPTRTTPVGSRTISGQGPTPVPAARLPIVGA